MTRRVSSVFAGLFAAVFPAGQALAQERLDFAHQVRPILESACVSCHGAEQEKGGLRLDSLAAALKGGDYGPALVPGDPGKSPLFTSTILPADHPDVMPPKEPLAREQAEMLRRWIVEGAQWPDDARLAPVRRIDFARDVQPIFEFNCVSCHRADYEKGDWRLDTKAHAWKPGGSGEAPIVPGFPEKSLLYKLTILAADDDDLMPPVKNGGPLPREITDVLRDWISQGAVWPEDVALVPRKPEEMPADSMAVARVIHKKIVERGSREAVASEQEMKAYSETIPGTDVRFQMVQIPGGEFLMGSPEGEAGRKPDEGPRVRVKVDPFWMGKFEVTWNEYELFMYPDLDRQPAAGDPANLYVGAVADAVSRPTRPYMPMSFGMGTDGFPAICMTQHAANKYCEWLSAQTGHFYRLPTEAEWEYAARAGSETAYHFGDDASLLSEYAWYRENAGDDMYDWSYRRIGTKKPNPWGLHDMHGNVAEWVLDQYDADFYQQLAGGAAHNPWNKATKPYPHAVRGGSYQDPAGMLRSAARLGSHPDWKIQDPQFPKSVWYHTDARFVGFRLVRPLAVPSAEEMDKYWTSGVEKE